MRQALTEQQTEAIYRLAAGNDGQSFLRLIAAELDGAITDLVDASDNARMLAFQGEARALRGILVTVDAAVAAVRGAPPANPLMAGGRPTQTGNPDRLPDNGGK